MPAMVPLQEHEQWGLAVVSGTISSGSTPGPFIFNQAGSSRREQDRTGVQRGTRSFHWSGNGFSRRESSYIDGHLSPR